MTNRNSTDSVTIESFLHLDSADGPVCCTIDPTSNSSCIFNVPPGTKDFPYKSRKFEIPNVLEKKTAAHIVDRISNNAISQIANGKCVVSFSLGTAKSSRDNAHFGSPSDGCGVSVLSSILSHLAKSNPSASISLFALRNSSLVDLLDPQNPGARIGVHRMKLDLSVSKHSVSSLISDDQSFKTADAAYRSIDLFESYHRVAIIWVSESLVMLFVDVVSLEWMSRKSLLLLGDRNFSYLQKCMSCFGDVMNAITMHRLRVPAHRADVTALLQLVMGTGSLYHVILGSHVNVSVDNIEESFFALQFVSRIGGLKGATVQPFGRDFKIDKCVLDREMKRLQFEFSLALAVTGGAKLSSSELTSLESTICLKRAKLEAESKQKESELQKQIDEQVSKLAQETMSALRSDIHHAQHQLTEASTAISVLRLKLASDDPKAFEKQVNEMNQQLSQTKLDTETEKEKINLLSRSISDKRMHLSTLERKRDLAQDEIRAAMTHRIESYESIRSSRTEQRKQWADQRAIWRSQVISSKGVAEKDGDPEYAVLREPLNKDLLSSLKKTFETIKAGVDDREISLNAVTDDSKGLSNALRYMDQHPVDWSVEDWDRLRAKEQNLLRDAEMQDKKLKDLVEKVILFLQHGTNLTKYRPFSKPGEKHFFLSSDCKSLCFCDVRDWDAAMSVGPGKERDKYVARSLKSVNLEEVRLFVLGQYSPLFAKWGVSFGSPEFYRSFSLYYGKSKQTLDVVADSDTDFEAWLIGLSSLVPVQPKWGSGIDVSHEPCFFELQDDEVDLCQSCHISPYFYKEAKTAVLEHFNTKGYVTKYDMRIVTGMDVLRCVKMHDLLESRGDILSRPVVRVLSFTSVSSPA
eukprot:ANDGO_02109.mRNA.1 hypothetical protein ABB37_05528